MNPDTEKECVTVVGNYRWHRPRRERKGVLARDGGPRGAGAGRAPQKPVALYMGTKCSLMPLAACGSDASFLKDGISSPFPTCRGLQAALKCSYRSDSVTRDWPWSFKSARCKGQDAKGLGGWAGPGGHDGRHEGVVRQDARVPPAEQGSELSRGTVRRTFKRHGPPVTNAAHRAAPTTTIGTRVSHVSTLVSQHALGVVPPRPRSTSFDSRY